MLQYTLKRKKKEEKMGGGKKEEQKLVLIFKNNYLTKIFSVFLLEDSFFVLQIHFGFSYPSVSFLAVVYSFCKLLPVYLYF